MAAPAHAPDADWSERLRIELAAFVDVMRAHPAAAKLNLTRIIDSDAGLLVAERVLGLLGQAGSGPREAAEIGSYLLCATIALVTSEPGPEPGLDGEARDAAVRNQRGRLGALPPARFPHVIAAVDFLADCRGPEQHFTRGLDLLIAGARSLLPPLDA